VDAFVADISARKRSEQLHQLSESRLHALVEANPHGLLIISDSGAIEMANPALEKLFGYAHGELYNRPVERLLPKALNLMHSESLHPPCVGHDDTATWVRIQGVHKDGHLLSMEMSMACFQEDGRELAVATVLLAGQHAMLEQPAVSMAS